MTLKAKKISLGALAAISIVAVPVATVVSCGSETKDGNKGGNGISAGESVRIPTIDWKSLDVAPSAQVSLKKDAVHETEQDITDAITNLLLPTERRNGDAIVANGFLDDASKTKLANKTKMLEEWKFEEKIVKSYYKISDTEMIKKAVKSLNTSIAGFKEILNTKTITFKFADGDAFDFVITNDEHNKLKEITKFNLQIKKMITNTDFLRFASTSAVKGPNAKFDTKSNAYKNASKVMTETEVIEKKLDPLVTELSDLLKKHISKQWSNKKFVSTHKAP